MQTAFGAGSLIATATQDAYGNALATPTPVQFGILQNVSLDISFDVKELYGSQQFPLAIGRGKGKITGKASAAQINGLMLNSVLFGQTVSSGILSDVIDLTGTTIPTTPYQVTPTIPGTGTWVNDLGVRDANGIPFVRVVSGPTTGQYSVAAGVYTFAAADTGKVVYISFQYTATSTSAKKMTIANVAMGYAPQFRMDFFIAQNGKPLIVSAGAALSTKFSMATKLDDFMIPDFEFSIFSDASGNLLSIGTAE